eukprot:scaffold4874_cov78-Cylindrotheca_fusiformis.AAC.1
MRISTRLWQEGSIGNGFNSIASPMQKQATTSPYNNNIYYIHRNPTALLVNNDLESAASGHQTLPHLVLFCIYCSCMWSRIQDA